MQEIWKDIEDFEGLYQISNKGRVKSLEHQIEVKRKKDTYTATIKEKIRKQTLDEQGYPTISLKKSGTSTTKKIHKLVAIAFLNHKPDNYNIVVDHIDNDRTNNNVNNLQLITTRKNCSKDSKNKTGYTGVYNGKKPNTFYTQIKFNGKKYSLGTYDTPEQASSVYQNAVKQIELGEFNP